MTAATSNLPSPNVPLTQDAAVIALVGLAHAASHFGHLLLPPLFPVFMHEFGLSFSQLGALTSGFRHHAWDMRSVRMGSAVTWAGHWPRCFWWASPR